MAGARRVGLVGLGNMGLPMARTLAAAGFAVTATDSAPERRAAFQPSRESVAELAAASDLLLLSLPNSQTVEAVVDAARPHLVDGTLIVDTSTSAPASTRALQARLAAQGIGYVDAPVSGGPAGARDGQLLVMAGGSAADLDAAMPVLEALAREVVRCGGPGAGNVTKLINNLLCAAHLALAGEALALAEAGGPQPAALLAALNLGSGRSGVSEVNLPRWVLTERFDSGFSMGLMRKDLKLALDLAEELGVSPELARSAALLWETSRDTLAEQEDFNRMVVYARDRARTRTAERARS